MSGLIPRTDSLAQHDELIQALRDLFDALGPLTCIARGEHTWVLNSDHEHHQVQECTHCGKRRMVTR